MGKMASSASLGRTGLPFGLNSNPRLVSHSRIGSECGQCRSSASLLSLPHIQASSSGAMTMALAFSAQAPASWLSKLFSRNQVLHDFI